MEKHSSNLITKSFAKLFKRFHLMIFFIFIVACLSAAVILVNQILTGEGTDTDYTSGINAGTIDQATLNQIQSLHISTEAPLPEVPGGRINPFSE